MRHRVIRFLLALSVSSALAAEKRPVNVAAAANLKDAADAIAQAFQAEHPEVEVKLTIGASGNFFAQIQNGAPFDLFLSADTEYPDKIVAAGLARAEDERVYAFGKLIAWLPAGSTLDLEKNGLAALRDSRVKHIAIANPAVAPFGRATV
ncbi:MAG TPA: molybdate ABC transporter substrate-binding protein, partial [Steroidobacteraceae bacterium]|nr:molybdate ABC transporter substrate-binding protein [Steroidobacteraceae bacterium]